MKMVPADLVEETWMEVGSYTGDRAEALINRIGKSQRNLLSFVFEFTADLGPDAHELAVYLFTVIYLIFERASCSRIRSLSQAEIKSAYERTNVFLEKYIGAHERFLENAAKSLSLPQPFVVKYLVEALLEAPDQGEDPVTLSDEDSGQIFIVLSTVIDLLHRVTSDRKCG